MEISIGVVTVMHKFGDMGDTPAVTVHASIDNAMDYVAKLLNEELQGISGKKRAATIADCLSSLREHGQCEYGEDGQTIDVQQHMLNISSLMVNTAIDAVVERALRAAGIGSKQEDSK